MLVELEIVVSSLCFFDDGSSFGLIIGIKVLLFLFNFVEKLVFFVFDYASVFDKLEQDGEEQV